MAHWVKVAQVDEIPVGKSKVVEVGGAQVALFNVEGTFYALDNICLHMGGPLGEGRVQGAVVTCPWHGWQYDVPTGTLLGNPSVNVQPYEVKVEGEDILIWTSADAEQQQREQEMMQRIAKGQSIASLAVQYRISETEVEEIFNRWRIGERLIWLGERYLKTGRFSGRDLLDLPYRDAKPVTYGVIPQIIELLRFL